jgi:hypothetical protein
MDLSRLSQYLSGRLFSPGAGPLDEALSTRFITFCIRYSNSLCLISREWVVNWWTVYFLSIFYQRIVTTVDLKMINRCKLEGWRGQTPTTLSHLIYLIHQKPTLWFLFSQFYYLFNSMTTLSIPSKDYLKQQYDMLHPSRFGNFRC